MSQRFIQERNVSFAYLFVSVLFVTKMSMDSVITIVGTCGRGGLYMSMCPLPVQRQVCFLDADIITRYCQIKTSNLTISYNA